MVPRGVILVSSAIALSLLGDQLLYTAIATIHDKVNVPVHLIGVLLSMNRFVRLFSNTVAGWIVSRCGRKWPFILSLVLAACVTTSYGFISGVAAFVVGRCAWGISWSFIRMEGMSTALDLATPSTKGRLMGTYQSISRLGGAAGMLFGGIMTDAFGYQKTFAIFGLLTAIGPVLAFIEMSSRNPDGQARHVQALPSSAYSKVDTAAPAAGGAGETLPGTSTTSTLEQPVANDEETPLAFSGASDDGEDGNLATVDGGDNGDGDDALGTDDVREPSEQPGYRGKVVATFLGGFTNRLVVDGVCTPLLGYALLSRYGATPALAGALVVPVASLTGTLQSTRGMVESVVAPVTGYLGDRWGRRNVNLVALPLVAVCVLLMAFELPIVAPICLMPIIYVGGVTLSVSFNTIAGDLAPKSSRSQFLSRYLTTNDLGAAIGPLVAYLLAPSIGCDTVYLMGCGAMVLMNIIYCAVGSGK